MAVMQSSGESPKSLLRKDDEAWLRSVLDLIPRSVYGEDSTHASLGQNPKNTNQKNAKSQFSETKRVAKQEESKERKDGVDNRHASLKKKLHEKILAKRVARKADEESYVESRTARKRKRDEKSSSDSREGKRHCANKKGVKENDGIARATDSDIVNGRGQRKRKLECEEGEDSNLTALETTRVTGFENDKPVRKVKRRKLKGRKLRELQKKLQEASKEKEVMKGKSDSSSGVKPGEEAIVNEGRSREMEKAMQRAQGIDVKDDVKKLKKSIRREKRKTEKSREDWAKRKKTQELEQKARLEKKARNLAERKGKKGSSKKKK